METFRQEISLLEKLRLEMGNSRPSDHKKMDEPPHISTKLGTYIPYQKLLIHTHFGLLHYMASELQLQKFNFWEIFSEPVILNWP